jgi:cell division protein FtsB
MKKLITCVLLSVALLTTELGAFRGRGAAFVAGTAVGNDRHDDHGVHRENKDLRRENKKLRKEVDDLRKELQSCRQTPEYEQE